MENKKCTRCNEIKLISDFHKCSALKSGIKPECKKCILKRLKNHSRTINGMVTTIYSDQRSSSRYRNHELPSYTKSELKSWLLSRSNFYELYDKWIESGYKVGLKPSVDRINDYKGYSMCNIQLMTFRANMEKCYHDEINGINTKGSKAVIQLDLNGNKISTFFSQREAERITGIAQQSIGKVCLGHSPSAGGYKWVSL